MMRFEDVPFYDFKVKRENLIGDVTTLVLNFLRPHWSRESLKTKVFTDGISNVLVGNFIGSSLSESEDVVLTRVYGEDTELFIDRDAEIKNLLFLNKHDCASQIYGRFSNGLCYQFIHGMVCTEEMVSDPLYSELIAKEMARLHSIPVKASDDDGKCIFDVTRRFIRLIPDKFKNSEMQRRYDSHFPSKDEYLKIVDAVQESILTDDIKLCYSHNDIFFRNVILNNDKDRIHFIDFEYGCINYEGFDIGNHFNEFAGVDEVDFSKYPSETFQRKWIRHYLHYRNKFMGLSGGVSERDIDRMYLLVNKFSLVSHLMYSAWGVIQAVYSKIDFDFFSYGIIRYAEFKRCRNRLDMTIDNGDYKQEA